MKNIKNITKNFLTEQYEMNRIFEAIEYDPEHPERMHPQIEDKLRRDDHYLSGNKSLPKSSHVMMTPHHIFLYLWIEVKDG